MVEFKNVTSRYRGGITGLDNVSFHLEKGSITGLLGPSGAGKSTIIEHITGELKAGSGEIVCMGVNPSKLSAGKLMRYRRRIGFIPQELNLFEHRTVYENIDIILRGIGLNRKDAQAKTENVLEIVGLRQRQSALPEELSGGEQQRVAIARAISVNPSLLLADEPTGNLDPKRSEEIMGLFKRINDMGITVLISTHEWKLMEKIGANILYIDSGQIKDFPGGAVK